MGPGMLVKAAVPRSFSIIVFGLTQIVIDLEVLQHMARNEYPFHTFWHTYLGATVIAGLAWYFARARPQRKASY